MSLINPNNGQVMESTTEKRIRELEEKVAYLTQFMDFSSQQSLHFGILLEFVTNKAIGKIQGEENQFGVIATMQDEYMAFEKQRKADLMASTRVQLDE